jgi:TetR/AcrR family transcriptional regulator, mexJK operon transcriptional repressor
VGPRDDQEFERRRKQIIEGALAVFAAKGFAKATNQDIAAAAGIGSPGLIYHYFKSKTDLLEQVMVSRTPLLQSMIHDDSMFDLPPRIVLRMVGTNFLRTLGDAHNQKLFRVIVGEATRTESVAEVWKRFGLLPGLTKLSAYLSSQMQAGTLRQADPIGAAHCFLGPFFFYLFPRVIVGDAELPALSQETLVDLAVEIFLRGMEVL